MQTVVSLSTKEKVHFLPYFSHKAERVFSHELNKGILLKEDESGKMQVTGGIPANNISEAVEASMMYMVEKVVGTEGTENSCTQAWLDGLKTLDYQKLHDALLRIKRNSEQDKEEGKKNDG